MYFSAVRRLGGEEHGEDNGIKARRYIGCVRIKRMRPEGTSLRGWEKIDAKMANIGFARIKAKWWAGSQ